MKNKNIKEIIILSLKLIAIIACIIPLILFKILMKVDTINEINGTIKDKFYLSQEPTMYVSKPIRI